EKWVGSLSCRQKLEKKFVNKSPALSTLRNWLWFFLVASTVFSLPFSSTPVTAWIFFFSLSITNSTSESCSGYCCGFSFVCSLMILIIYSLHFPKVGEAGTAMPYPSFRGRVCDRFFFVRRIGALKLSLMNWCTSDSL